MGFSPLTNDLVGLELLDGTLVEGDLVVTYRRSRDPRLYAHEVPEAGMTFRLGWNVEAVLPLWRTMATT